MDNNAEVVVVLDNDKAYGIQAGYYKDYKPVRSCEVISENEFYERKLSLISPSLNGTDIYIRDPYTGKYLSFSDSNLEIKLVESKVYAIREALIMMGAKDILLKEEASSASESETNFGSGVKVGLYGNGDVKVDTNKKFALSIKTKIETHNTECRPKPAKEVKKFLEEHNLLYESNLYQLAGRLERDGHLAGSDDVAITFNSEIDSALNVLCSVNYKVFNSNLDFEAKKSCTHNFEKKIKVNW